MTTIVYGTTETACRSAQSGGEDLWISPSDLETATGWNLKPEGLCRGEMCMPVTSGTGAHLTRDRAINVADFWRYLGQPIAHDDAGEVWVLGSSAVDRTKALQSLEAPDFVLPDLTGEHVALSQHRGKKVLLATWASW